MKIKVRSCYSERDKLIERDKKLKGELKKNE